jgi:glutathione S-transferase
MAWVLIVMVLALFQFYGFGVAVARARSRHGIAAPAITGHPGFERYFRVQMNTLEQLVAFLPAIWLFAQFVDPHWAAGLGVVYLTGRQIYFFSYVKDPRTRSLGFGLTSMPILIMLAGVLYAAVMMLLVN